MIKFILWDFYNVLYFPRHDEVNTELFEFIEDHNKRVGFGVLSAVHTDLSEWLQARKLASYFMFIKTTQEFDMPKTDPGIYEPIIASFELKPSEVLLVDDLSENLNAAKEAGLKTLRYVKSRSFATQLSDAKIKV